MRAADVPTVTLYARQGCHLCDEARQMLDALLAERQALGRPAAVVERDIDADPALHDAFHLLIPVVEVGDCRLDLVTSQARLRRFLAESLDGTAAVPSGAAASAPDVTA